MLKILYAADNRPSSFYSLKRFLDVYGKFYDIRIAAYTKSVGNLVVNWNLDALLDFRGKCANISLRNSNYALYAREIRRFAPNLVISDLEIYTSNIAIDAGIHVWQVSPLLLYYGTEDKLNIYKYYGATFFKDTGRLQYTNYILNNSSKRLVFSHLSDLHNRPILKNSYEWVRPNYELLETNTLLTLRGDEISLADSYYSNLYNVIDTDYTDHEAIICSKYNIHYNLSGEKSKTSKFETTINSDVKFLSQYLKELDI